MIARLPQIVALFAAALLVSCGQQDARIETPREVATTEIQVKFHSSADWVASLRLSPARKLLELSLSCAGAEYANAPGGDDFPDDVFGARLDVYSGTTCQRGQAEVTIFTLTSGQSQGLPGQYIPVIFYFADGHFVGRSDIRGAQHLRPPHVQE